jgi:hypothetical protein
LNGKSWKSDSNGYPHMFDHARLKYVIADTARHRPISGTGNVDKNRKWKPEMEITFERKELAK